jgi:hypothetical protein
MCALPVCHQLEICGIKATTNLNVSFGFDKYKSAAHHMYVDYNNIPVTE